MILLDGQKDVYMPVKLLRELAGDAKIYLCENQKSQSFVVKIYDGLQENCSEVRQFLYHVDSPYIMKLLDHGIVELHEKRCIFEIYDYMPEGTWDLLAPVDPRVVEEDLIPCLNEGLHEIHEAGLLHRDVKPDNLYVGKDDKGHWTGVYGDFGISVPMGADGNYCDAALAYTPGYVPVEVLGSGCYSAASDYYGLGVTIYYLLTGKQIFYGLSPEEIMMKTRQGNVISYSGISDRFAELIEGLMVQDPRYRWGYSEVKQWLEGARVPVFRFAQEKQVLDPPYMLTAQISCRSLRELAQALADNPEEGRRHLHDGLLAEAMKKQYPYLNKGLMDIVENQFPHQNCAGLTAAIKLIDSDYEGFYWDGIHYNGLNDLLLMVRQNLACDQQNASVTQLCNSGILSYYYGKDLSSEDLALLKQIEKIGEKDTVKAQSLLVLNFLPEAVFQIGENVLIHNLEEYIGYLVENRQDVQNILVRDLNKSYFQDFVKSCGWENQFHSWHSYFYHGGKIVADGHIVGNICQFLAEVCPEQDKNLKGLVMDEIQGAPEYWLKDHLDLYQMDEMMERMVHDNFAEVRLSEEMSIQALLKEQHRMKECMHELRRDLLNNYALLEQGIYDTAGYRIIPLHADGLFVPDHSGAMVPVGWLIESQGLSGKMLAKSGYQKMREEASDYINKSVEQTREWSRTCKNLCEQRQRERQRPGIVAGVFSMAFSAMAMLVLVLISRNLEDSGLITLGGFGLTFLATILLLVAGVHRFIKVLMWKRLTRSARNLMEIGASMLEREKQFSLDNIGELKPHKNNLETEAQVERATGSNLLNIYRMKNGVLRYAVLVLLSCGIMGIGLAHDGILAGSGSDLKAGISSIFEGGFHLSGSNQEESGKQGKNFLVSVDVARMRSGPGTDYEILNVYEEGSIMVPTGEKKKVEEYTWYEVTGPDMETGWMRSDTIEKE